MPQKWFYKTRMRDGTNEHPGKFDSLEAPGSAGVRLFTELIATKRSEELVIE